MFYALFDNQTGRYMGTGFNNNSISQLGQSYSEYISIDIDEEEEGDMIVMEKLKSGFETDIISIITGNEFSIYDSETAFCEDCFSTDTNSYNDIETGLYMCECKKCHSEFELLLD